jgi:hypothetical protein
MIKCGLAARGGQLFSNIMLAGHCGGADQPGGPGVLFDDPKPPSFRPQPFVPGLAKPWKPPRFDAPSLNNDPDLVECIQNGLAGFGTLRLCTCGYMPTYVGKGGYEEWLRFLVDMATKLQRRVCACPVTGYPAAAAGCRCDRAVKMVCVRPRDR